MSEDRPLSEFAEDSSNSAASDSDPASNTEDIADDTDPATATYRWQPDGAACAHCGATTERQWRDDDAFVCPDCKAW